MVFTAKPVFRLVNRMRRSRSQSTEPADSISVVVTDARSSSGAAVSSLAEPEVPAIFYLAQCWAWESISFRCETHPHEISSSITDGNGDNVLHWVSFGNPPVEVVDALLIAEPGLAKVANNCGQFPLHEVVRSILDAYPEAACIPDRSGSYPLHKLCDHGCSPQSLQCLLENSEASATIQIADLHFGRKPLQLLTRRRSLGEFHDQLTRARALRRKQQLLKQQSTMDEEEWLKCEKVLASYRSSDFWRNASILLVTEAAGKWKQEAPESADVAIVNACATIDDCPDALREFGFLLHADKLLVRNSDGNLCIHTLIRKKRYDHLHELIALEPRACEFADPQGELPLTLALQHMPKLSWRTGIGAIVEAHPAALEQMDLSDREIVIAWVRLTNNPSALFLAIKSRTGMIERCVATRREQ